MQQAGNGKPRDSEAERKTKAHGCGGMDAACRGYGGSLHILQRTLTCSFLTQKDQKHSHKICHAINNGIKRDFKFYHPKQQPARVQLIYVLLPIVVLIKSKKTIQTIRISTKTTQHSINIRLCFLT